MAHLRIHLFGKPEIYHNGSPLSFRTRKALALLVYLVVEGGSHSRAKLATMFWPDSDPAAGRATLRSTLRYLRKPLEHDTDDAPHLNVSRSALSFNLDADYELDLDKILQALERKNGRAHPHSKPLRQAAAVHRGYFLEGFSLPDAPAFDQWVSLQQEHWHLRLSELFERLVKAQAQEGETAAAIQTAARWTTFEPYKEAAYRQLMRLQLAAGDRAGAMQSYQTCRQTLAEELGIEPAPKTRALLEQIQGTAQDAAPDTGRLPAQENGRPQPPDSKPKSKLPFPFVGRHSQHTRLVEAYYQSESEQPQVVVIEGEAGIGKTRLAQEFLSWAAAQGAETVQGRAFETGGRLPYQPLIDALRPLTPRLPDLLSPTWLGELSRLLPELNDLVADLPSPTTDEKLGRSRLFEAVTRLGTELAAQTPIVLFLDDLQWAGSATLDLLSHIARRWQEEGCRILLSGALRTEALHRAASSESLREWLHHLEREAALLRLKLEPLAEAELDQFVQKSVHKEADPAQVKQFSGWLFRETQGQPFYLTETIEALLEDGSLVTRPVSKEQSRLAFSPNIAQTLSRHTAGPTEGFVPPGVRDVVRVRLARLSDAAFNLLVAASILGQAFDFQGLCRVAGLRRNEALPSLDRLLGMRLLVESEQEKRPYTFAHDKIRDVVYTEAGDARRQLFHERALAHLSQAGIPAAQLAHHAFLAEKYQAAFPHSLQAGENAMNLFAIQDAIFHYKQAYRTLAENPAIRESIGNAERHRLYERLGRGYELVNEWEAAQETYEEMLADARKLERPSMEAAALNRLATIKIIWKLDPDGALSILEEARAAAERSGDKHGQAEAEWNSCLAKFYKFDRPPALAHGERAITLAREIGDRELIAKSLNAAGYAASGVNQWEKVGEYGRDAQALYAEMGNRALEADSVLLVAFAETNTGRTQSGLEAAREGLRISREIGNQWGKANAINHLTAALLDMGRYGEAFATVQKVFSLEQVKDAPQYMAAFTMRGMVYQALLDYEKALEDHLQAQEHIYRLGNPDMKRVLTAHITADYAALGRWEEAYEEAQIAMQTKDFGWYYAGFHYWAVIEGLLHGGEEKAAEKDITRLEKAVGRYPRYKLIVERCKAVLKKWRGDIEGAAGHLQTALEMTETHQGGPVPLPGERWPLLVELTKLTEEMGDEETAASHRRHAREIVQSIAEQIGDVDLREGFLGRAADLIA